jgi:hypothetical protein
MKLRCRFPLLTAHPPAPAPRAGVTSQIPRPAGESGMGFPPLRGIVSAGAL